MEFPLILCHSQLAQYAMKIKEAHAKAEEIGALFLLGKGMNHFQRIYWPMTNSAT